MINLLPLETLFLWSKLSTLIAIILAASLWLSSCITTPPPYDPDLFVYSKPDRAWRRCIAVDPIVKGKCQLYKTLSDDEVQSMILMDMNTLLITPAIMKRCEYWAPLAGGS